MLLKAGSAAIIVMAVTRRYAVRSPAGPQASKCAVESEVAAVATGMAARAAAPFK